MIVNVKMTANVKKLKRENDRKPKKNVNVKKKRNKFKNKKDVKMTLKSDWKSLILSKKMLELKLGNMQKKNSVSIKG